MCRFLSVRRGGRMLHRPPPRGVDAMPKTRSGKVMRRPLREAVTTGRVTGDTTWPCGQVPPLYRQNNDA
ncbi:MAG: hypothetical protein DIU76_02845 [Bacillota bacterium]|nr:MAG: hypothetical protein DIU76_02845 [Bacillota bacterium]